MSVWLTTLSPLFSHFKSTSAYGSRPVLLPHSVFLRGGSEVPRGDSGKRFVIFNLHMAVTKLLQAEHWCHPCVGPALATRCMGRLLSVMGVENLPLLGVASPFQQYDECGAALFDVWVCLCVILVDELCLFLCIQQKILVQSWKKSGRKCFPNFCWSCVFVLTEKYQKVRYWFLSIYLGFYFKT